MDDKFFQRYLAGLTHLSSEAIDSASRFAQADLAAKLVLSNTIVDLGAYARNLSDQLGVNTWVTAVRELQADHSEALKRATEVWASFRLQAASLAESLIDNQRLISADKLGISKLIQDSYTQLSEMQSHFKALPTDVTSQALTDLLSAQSTWAHTVQFPSSLEDKHLLFGETTKLIDQISTLSTRWNRSEEAPREKERTVEQEIGVVRERLAAAFSEKSPRVTVRKLQEFLASAVSGSIHLSPRAGAILLTILLNLISSLLFDTTKSFLLTRTKHAPRIAPEIRREIRKLQAEIPDLPADLRVVLARELTARRAPRKSSPAVGRLYGGDLVRLVNNRGRSWALVEFRDKDGEIVLRGWVFSRSIEPLRRHGRKSRALRGGRLARLQRQGLLRRASAPLSRKLLMASQPQASNGASALGALLDERRNGR